MGFPAVVAEDVEAKLARTTPATRPDDPLDAWVADTVQRALAYAVTLVRDRAEAEDLVHDCYIRLLARSEHYEVHPGEARADVSQSVFIY